MTRLSSFMYRLLFTFLSLLFLLELLPNFIVKTDVQEQSTPSILGAK